tara:strand:+ start:4959 stop:5120 length:162 start_codon:yes stop_codon:yes gene_type:complete
MLNKRFKIKSWGNTLVITIDAEDARLYNFKEGDVINVSISKVIENVLDNDIRY